MKRLFVSTVVILLAISSSSFGQKRPKNIILMIGDGMGLSQITAGMYANGNHLNLESFRYIGLIKTHSQDNLITDSAAGATAFATGQKTYNGAIGVDSTGKHLTSILELAHENGLATGVISTSTIQHATPASFYAHQPTRTMYEDIASDFLRGTVDVAIGGGMRLLVDRRDKRNIAEELQDMGYFVCDNLSDAINQSNNRVIALIGKGHLKSMKRGRGNILGNAAKAAISKLNENSNGFFLMIEGSQIDWGGHSNDANYIIKEMIDFDQTIGKVLDFAKEDGETLVIITADHETGGFAINKGNKDLDILETEFTTDDHTATLIPVFAYGPGAEAFTGIYENTQIFHKMLAAYKFKKHAQKLQGGK